MAVVLRKRCNLTNLRMQRYMYALRQVRPDAVVFVDSQTPDPLQVDMGYVIDFVSVAAAIDSIQNGEIIGFAKHSADVEEIGKFWDKYMTEIDPDLWTKLLEAANDVNRPIAPLEEVPAKELTLAEKTDPLSGESESNGHSK